MRTHAHGNMIWISLMILVFWLIILFLDGAFSSGRILPQDDEFPLDVEIVSLSTEYEGNDMHEEEISVSPIVSDQEIATMVTDSVHTQLGGSEIFKDLNVLEYLYQKNKNPDLLQPMIDTFLQYYQFDKANTYLTLLVAEKGDYFDLDMDPHKVLYIRFHDSTISLDRTTALDEVFSLMQAYKTRNMLNYDDELFYKGLKALWMYDYTNATQHFAKITDSRYKDFKVSYDSSLANYMKIQNPPVYYRDGLISLALLKNGYFTIAKRLALRAVTQNGNYILPYQVLAYTNFLTHNWEAAKDYFLKLANFDADNVFLYRFLIGVSYYWHGDYEQSILYLNQVTDPRLQVDVYRYMLLSYIHGNDTTHVVRMFHNLLGQDTLQASDFALFFDQMFFVPFRLGKPFEMYFENTQLVDLYLGKCSALFTGSQADVCVYGEVGLQLAKQNLSSVGTTLLDLTQSYQQSYLYHILGDYYIELNQYTMAKDAYVKALSICEDINEQSILKSKIINLN